MFSHYAETAPRPGPPPNVRPMLRVGFILSPRFSILPFASFVDALRHAADEGDFSRQIYCSWKTISAEPVPVKASCGLEVNPEALFGDPREFDHIVVVGGQLPYCLDLPEQTLAYLRQAHRAGVTLIGICTGSFILARAGLLSGLRCSVHSEHSRQISTWFPDVIPVTDHLFMVDANIITCPGGTSAIDLAFALIQSHCGRDRAAKGLMSLFVSKERAAQLPHYQEFGHLAACGEADVRKAMVMMQSNLVSPFPVNELAERLQVSENRLRRLFLRHAKASPAEVWRRLRLAQARWLLINSNRNVTQIAMDCGFSDSPHFIRNFKDRFGLTPKAFRAERLVKEAHRLMARDREKSEEALSRD